MFNNDIQSEYIDPRSLLSQLFNNFTYEYLATLTDEEYDINSPEMKIIGFICGMQLVNNHKLATTKKFCSDIDDIEEKISKLSNIDNDDIEQKGIKESYEETKEKIYDEYNSEIRYFNEKLMEYQNNIISLKDDCNDEWKQKYLKKYFNF